MGYLLVLLTYILFGLILTRKLSVPYKKYAWAYWASLVVVFVQAFVFHPYRLARVVYDFQNLGRYF